MVIIFLKRYLYKTENLIHWFPPQMTTIPWLGQFETKSQKLHLVPPTWVGETQVVEPSSYISQVHTSRSWIRVG